MFVCLMCFQIARRISVFQTTYSGRSVEVLAKIFDLLYSSYEAGTPNTSCRDSMHDEEFWDLFEADRFLLKIHLNSCLYQNSMLFFNCRVAPTASVFAAPQVMWNTSHLQVHRLLLSSWFSSSRYSEASPISFYVLDTRQQQAKQLEVAMTSMCAKTCAAPLFLRRARWTHHNSLHTHYFRGLQNQL